jgi:hypothetical protein
VIHDCNGNFIATGRSKIENVQDALLAEAHALRQGLLLAHTEATIRL